MTDLERQYRNTVNRIAFALLIFLVLFFVRGAVISLFEILLAGATPMVREIVCELVGALCYAITFTLPVFLFKKVSIRMRREPIYLDCKLGRDTALYIVVGLALISAAALVNSYIVSFFPYQEMGEAVTGGISTTANYQLVIQFFTLAVVPAFVEEYLFRGMILTNLLPYGKTSAILASAALFGIMHQNVGQLFYATVAGLVLGYIYVKSRSIWPCILLHFINNFYSLFNSAIYDRVSKATADVILSLISAMIFLAAIVCVVILLLGQRDRRQKGEEQEEKESASCADELLPQRKLLLFFSFPMIAFLAACLVQTVSNALMMIFLA